MRKNILLSIMCMASLLSAAVADTLKLKSGETLEGRVIEQTDAYWFKDSNGQTRVVPKDGVEQWVKTAMPSLPPAAPAPGPPAAPRIVPPPAAGGVYFGETKSRADLCQTPIQAVGLWQSFIDNHPSASDLPKAKAELARWKEMSDGNAEKIYGKWVWGEDRKAIIDKCDSLLMEADQAMRANQTLVAMDKVTQALKAYPNSFVANFELGFFNLSKGAETKDLPTIDLGIHSLEAASRLEPESAAVWSNLAIGYFFREKFELSILTAYKAAKLEDSKPIVQNLLNALMMAPPNLVRVNSKIKPIAGEAALLASKYALPLARGPWSWVHATGRAPGGEGTAGPPGIFANGTGFFISSDGYILTNRHVAKPGDYLMVRLADGTEKVAQRVIIDDMQDVAVIRIQPDAPVPFLRLADYEHPPAGADVAVFGFPMLSQFGLNSSVEMTRGIVTAWDKDQDYCDVTVDAQVNPGNSGGPMVDRRGNLLALTAMKTLSSTSVSSYGLGLSTGRLRQFFEHQQKQLAGLKVETGKSTDADLSNEELARRLTPATVCILCCRGTPPESGQRAKPAVPLAQPKHEGQ